MVLDLIAQPIASLFYRKVKHTETSLGYKLLLHQEGENWLNATLIFDMSSVWKKFGLDARGVNYLTIGRIKNGMSSRFDYTSPYYQSWLGGYIVKFSESRKWTINDHFLLGEADQKNWLKLYGVDNPEENIDYKSVKNLGEIKIGKYHGTLYQGNIASNTDVGNKANRIYIFLTWLGGVYFFKQDNPKLHLEAKNFLPQWVAGKSKLDPYQLITLRGYVCIVDISEDLKAILYVNGCQFMDSSGKRYDTFRKLYKDFKKDLAKIEIVKLA